MASSVHRCDSPMSVIMYTIFLSNSFTTDFTYWNAVFSVHRCDSCTCTQDVRLALIGDERDGYEVHHNTETSMGRERLEAWLCKQRKSERVSEREREREKEREERKENCKNIP